MSEFELKIKGITELKRALFAYNAKLGTRVAQLAVRQGANFMLKQIRAAAPVKTGRLKRAIKVKNSRINRIAGNGIVGVYIAIDPGKSRKDMKGAWYGKFVETGYNHGSKASSRKLNKNEAKALHQRKKALGLKYRDNRMQASIVSRAGGKAVSGKHFVSNTFNRTKKQTAHIVVDAFELAGKRLASELGLKTGG